MDPDHCPPPVKPAHRPDELMLHGTLGTGDMWIWFTWMGVATDLSTVTCVAAALPKGDTSSGVGDSGIKGDTIVLARPPLCFFCMCAARVSVCLTRCPCRIMFKQCRNKGIQYQWWILIWRGSIFLVANLGRLGREFFALGPERLCPLGRHLFCQICHQLPRPLCRCCPLQLSAVSVSWRFRLVASLEKLRLRWSYLAWCGR